MFSSFCSTNNPDKLIKIKRKNKKLMEKRLISNLRFVFKSFCTTKSFCFMNEVSYMFEIESIPPFSINGEINVENVENVDIFDDESSYYSLRDKVDDLLKHVNFIFNGKDENYYHISIKEKQ